MTETTYFLDTPQRAGRRRRTAVAGALALVLLAGGGWWGYRTWWGAGSDPEVQAATRHLQSFLDAWEAGKAPQAARLTDSPKDAESLLSSVTTNLKPSKTVLEAGEGNKDEAGTVTVPFHAQLTVPGAGDFTYDSKATLVQDNGWRVRFSSPLVHPDLRSGQTLALKTAAPRAPVLAGDGKELEVASLRGTVGPNGKGSHGLEKRYDRQLSGGGGPVKEVVVADRATGRALSALTHSDARPGKPVRTTIDPEVQAAAAEALDGLDKNAALVAVQPSTGHILAVANRPTSGLNRALAGSYAPGSTFKVVTAAALLKGGLKPQDVVECPKFARAGGQRFENQGQFTLPSGSTFADVFAKSCNTAFIGNRAKVADPALREAAAAFGIGGTWDVGYSTYDGSVPKPRSDNELAASTIGQGRVQASPLVMASIAATVKQGEFRQPVLVPGAVKNRHKASADFDPEVIASLRTMMRGTVTYGAGDALRGLAGEPHAKTGTAEFGEEKPPRTHAWMIGYQGDSDLAWSVLLEDGGSGGSDAGPVAARFLKALAE